MSKTNKELESFSYTVSHDLRAPLRIITGYGNILLCREKNNLDGESITILEDIIGSAGRMRQLIDDLLIFSKMGRTPLTKCPVNMNDELKAIVSEVKKSLNDNYTLNMIQQVEYYSPPLNPTL